MLNSRLRGRRGKNVIETMYLCVISHKEKKKKKRPEMPAILYICNLYHLPNLGCAVKTKNPHPTPKNRKKKK